MRAFSLRIIAGMVMAAVVALGPVSAHPAQAAKASTPNPRLTPSEAAPVPAQEPCHRDDTCPDPGSDGDHRSDSPCPSDGRPHKAGEKPDCHGDGSGHGHQGEPGDGKDRGCDADHDGKGPGLVGRLVCALRGDSA